MHKVETRWEIPAAWNFPLGCRSSDRRSRFLTKGGLWGPIEFYSMYDICSHKQAILHLMAKVSWLWSPAGARCGIWWDHWVKTSRYRLSAVRWIWSEDVMQNMVIIVITPYCIMQICWEQDINVLTKNTQKNDKYVKWSMC